jgi:2-oxoisovalerate dehydrogenase E1 component
MTTPVAPPTTAGHWGGFPVDEVVEDFRLACLSRALDDREILLQKQSRVFFQISGAGHEILLVALARSLRPAYDWFFPYYRDRALVLALGRHPTRHPARGGGLVGGSGLRWSADAVPLG